jgi:archaeal flagellar protein FlaH
MEDEYLLETITTGNEEVDRQLGGGIPTPSLILLEGDHGTGKSALAAQIMKGMLDSRKKVICITENTINDYIEKMKSITFNFSHRFLQGRLVFVPLHVKGANWSKERASNLLSVIGKFIKKNSNDYSIVIIDSLSLPTIYADTESLLNFFSECKQLVTRGLTIIVTSHPDDMPKDVTKRVTSICDGYLKLDTAPIGDKEVKLMKIVKLIGAKSQPEAGFAFDIDMNFGIKIIPVSMANA